MFNTAAGVKIPFPEVIKEEFQLFDKSIVLNLSFEKIKPMLLDFIDMTGEPLFIALHLPLSKDEEAKLRKTNKDPFHEKICYLDGQTKEQVLDIINKYGEILLNDGTSQFAVAAHRTMDDFFLQLYKVIEIYSKEPEKFRSLMIKYGLNETKDIKTAWDTFSSETPGECRRYKHNGKNVKDVYDELVKLGMYEAKIVES